MVYVPTTPTSASENPADSQPQITENFEVLDTYLAVNHEQLATSGAGKHIYLQMPEQGSAPTTIANEGGLYTAVGSTSSQTELVYRRESDGDSIAFTESVNTSASGWSRLPSGQILGWQNLSVNSGDQVTMLGMTTIYQVSLTVEDNTNPATRVANVYNISGNQFNVSTSSGGAAIRIMAIGV